MHVFVTGASGLIGKALIPQLVAAHHTVSAIARSEKSAATIKELGASEVFTGSIDDAVVLTRACRSADAVIHLAFDHDLAFQPGGYVKACEKDEIAVKTMCEALTESGGGKTFITSSGLLAVKGDDELSGRDKNPAFPRWKSEDLALSYSEKGLRALIVCLPEIVHGPDAVHPFVGVQISVAKQAGYVGYIEDGKAIWQSVHVKDAAKLYTLGLEKGPAGCLLFPIQDEVVPTKEIAEFIAKKMALPLKAIKAEDAVSHWGFIGLLLNRGHKITPKYSKEWTGWQPTEYGLFQELDGYSY